MSDSQYPTLHFCNNNLILLWGVTQKGYPNQAHGIENIANHAFNENHFMVLKDDGVVDIW
ncbi:unnamed protein product [Ilex paraguariensis]|uniref:Uncharacterized protein n=1 Tax=Ilex paraguariensis TaxID=185542 RepID=A0ABC8TFN9_9AQUA